MDKGSGIRLLRDPGDPKDRIRSPNPAFARLKASLSSENLSPQDSTIYSIVLHKFVDEPEVFINV